MTDSDNIRKAIAAHSGILRAKLDSSNSVCHLIGYRDLDVINGKAVPIGTIQYILEFDSILGQNRVLTHREIKLIPTEFDLTCKTTEHRIIKKALTQMNRIFNQHEKSCNKQKNKSTPKMDNVIYNGKSKEKTSDNFFIQKNENSVTGDRLTPKFEPIFKK